MNKLTVPSTMPCAMYTGREAGQLHWSNVPIQWTRLVLPVLGGGQTGHGELIILN